MSLIDDAAALAYDAVADTARRYKSSWSLHGCLVPADVVV
jgi:hypothetical protein